MRTFITRGMFFTAALLCLALIFPFSGLAAPTLVNADAPNLPDKARGVPMGGALRVHELFLDAYGTVDLELERFGAFAPDAIIEVVGGPSVPAPSNAYFRGKTSDNPDAIVFMSVPEKGGKSNTRGVIVTGEGAWLMESRPGNAGLKTRKVDLKNELADKTFECLVGNHMMSAESLLAETAGAESAGMSATVGYTAHMVVDTDYEYWLKFWNIYQEPSQAAAAALEYLGDLLAYASIPYEREINTNLQIKYARLFADNSDPYDSNSNACGCDGYGKLDEVQDEWDGNPMDRTLVAFISGKTEGCGCAYVGVLCSKSDGYAAISDIGTTFNIDDPGFMWEGMVVAHEIGHNFNAKHTHENCGHSGIDDPTDVCVDSCRDPDLAPALPGLGSLTGGTAGAANGTIMSYCHQRSGGYANIAHTFGLYHPYGVAAWRVPARMIAHVQDNAGCMALEYYGSDVRIFKDCKPDDPMIAGDTAICTIVVENFGPETALGVVAVDKLLSSGAFTLGAITATKGSSPMPAGTCTITPNPQNGAGTVTCALGDIAAGHAVTIQVPVSADTAQNINNRVTVTSDSADPDTTNNMAEDEVNIIAVADLAIQKTDAPDPVIAGNNLTYTLTVTNNGPSAASNVVVKDILPAQVSLVSTTPSQGSCNGGVPGDPANPLNWNVGTLASGNSATLTVVVHVGPNTPNGTILLNNAAASSDCYDPDNGNNNVSASTTVLGGADLSITKTDSPDPVNAGENITYTLTVNNAGPALATNVVVQDVLPANVNLISVTPSQGSWSGSATITCNLGNIASGGNATITIVVKVSPDIPNGATLVNSASVSSDIDDPNPVNDNAVAETTIAQSSADISIVKSAVPTTAIAGTDMTFYYEISNAGPSVARNVRLRDLLPPEVIFKDAFIITQGGVGGVASPCSCELSSGSNEINCPVGDISLTVEPVLVIVNVHIRPDVPHGTVITNNASLTSDTADPDPGNNADDTDVTVNAEADRKVVKTSDLDEYKPSTIITYTITVTNNGPSDAQGVYLWDYLPDAKYAIYQWDDSGGVYYDKPARLYFDIGKMAFGETKTITVYLLVNGNRGIITNTIESFSSTTDPITDNNISVRKVKIVPGLPKGPKK